MNSAIEEKKTNKPESDRVSWGRGGGGGLGRLGAESCSLKAPSAAIFSMER